MGVKAPAVVGPASRRNELGVFVHDADEEVAGVVAEEIARDVAPRHRRAGGDMTDEADHA